VLRVRNHDEFLPFVFASFQMVHVFIFYWVTPGKNEEAKHELAFMGIHP